MRVNQQINYVPLGSSERCMQAMNMTLPKALVWQRVRNLNKSLSSIESAKDDH
jgi:hypothetical protein